jgi:16S rRNA processing protein RimM
VLRGVRTTSRSRSKSSARTVADSPYVPVGRVVKTHGLKGEVSVAPTPGLLLTSLVGVDVWISPPPSRSRFGRIESVRPGPKGPLVKLTGFDDLDASRATCGCELLARRDDLPQGWEEPLGADDLVGRSVEDVERGLLGTIVEVIVTGANDVWVVQGPFGEVLIPVIDDVVVSADVDGGTIAVKLLDGLMPGEGESA